MARTPPARPGAWIFAAWAAVGAAFCVAVLTPFTLALLVLPLAVAALIALLAWGRSRNVSALGLPAGAGVVLLYVAYLNRDGPGNVCTTTAGGQSCITEWSPWPWLAAGLLFAGACAGAFAWLRAHAAHGQ